MNKFKCREGSAVFQRVTKTAARKAWEANKTVVFCPANLYPFGGFRPSITMHPQDGRSPFDEVVRDFEYYNCTCSETGKYASFFVEGDSQ